ncbi:hypothetical protein [Bradyrhizobium sp. USDA 313]|uniref:hypothetical protein n=1 Tax=Bradyrhizobium sp. USDA 313 TaxID=3156307 RepID=UPI0035183322
MTVTIIPAAQGWNLCVLNETGDDLDHHPVIAWHIFEADLPPIPVLVWGTHRPDPYALHFAPADRYYARGASWQMVDRDEAIKRLKTDGQ